VSGRGADQSRAPDMHLPDGVRHLFDRGDILDYEFVRQKPLIDYLYDPLVRRVNPNRSIIFCSNPHVRFNVASRPRLASLSTEVEARSLELEARIGNQKSHGILKFPWCL